MGNLKQVINDFFAGHNIDINNKKVIIGVSTGVDSMVLLDLMAKYTNAKVVVCHVNHGKREASITEEAFINEYCKNANIPLYVYHIKHEEIESGNFQEEARIIRYKFFKDTAKKEGAEVILLAHHLNDDIETMLFRIQRGSNLAGYAGIPEVVTYDGGIIARPLLSVLKKDILEYANANSITYFEDASNSTNDYARNVIRHNDVPNIFDNIDDAAKNFVQMKENIKNASIILNEYRDNLINALVKCGSDYYSFEIDKFLKLHEYIQKEIIFELTKEKKLTGKNVDEIFKIINSSKANIKAVTAGLTIVKSYNMLYLFMHALPKKEKSSIIINNLDELVYNIDNLEIVISDINSPKCKSTITNCYVMCYNYNILPIEIRDIAEGDAISLPVGTKKVNRILIDNHVGLLERENVKVVVKDGVVLMVVGYCKSLKALEKFTKLDECNMLITFTRKDD